jgi:hypothetical protein
MIALTRTRPATDERFTIDADELARQADGERPIPVIEVDLVYRRGRARNAGIVHEAVEAAEIWDG